MNTSTDFTSLSSLFQTATEPTSKPQFTPGSIGPAKQTRVSNRVKQKAKPPTDDIWDENEIEEQEDVDPRPEPE